MLPASNLVRLLLSHGVLKESFPKSEGCGRGRPSNFEDSLLLATKHKVTYNFCIHCPIFTKLHRLHLCSTQNAYICQKLHMLIAPPAGGQKRHFLRLALLRLAGILTSCSTLDGRLCGAHRTESSAYPDVHTCEGPFMAACSFNYVIFTWSCREVDPVGHQEQEQF